MNKRIDRLNEDILLSELFLLLLAVALLGGAVRVLWRHADTAH